MTVWRFLLAVVAVVAVTNLLLCLALARAAAMSDRAFDRHDS
jgi:hypothetical protein